MCCRMHTIFVFLFAFHLVCFGRVCSFGWSSSSYWMDSILLYWMSVCVCCTDLNPQVNEKDYLQCNICGKIVMRNTRKENNNKRSQKHPIQRKDNIPSLFWFFFCWFSRSFQNIECHHTVKQQTHKRTMTRVWRNEWRRSRKPKKTIFKIKNNRIVGMCILWYDNVSDTCTTCLRYRPRYGQAGRQAKNTRFQWIPNKNDTTFSSIQSSIKIKYTIAFVSVANR